MAYGETNLLKQSIL